MAQILRRPEINYANLTKKNESIDSEVVQQVEIAIKYSGYIERQQVEVDKFKSMEGKQIPTWIDYAQVPSLRTEARQKLGKIRPTTLGQASRISGISPADVSLLMVCMKRGPKSNVETCAAMEHFEAADGNGNCCRDL